MQAARPHLLVAAAATALTLGAAGGDAAPLSPAAWQTFLSRSDPIFSWSLGQSDAAAPTKWYEAAFTGNGALGMMVRATQSPGGKVVDGLRFDVGRTDIYDDRASQQPGSSGADPAANRTNFACDSPRLPIGIFLAHFASNNNAALNAIDMRIDLYNGEVRGSVQPSGGGACDFELWSNAVYSAADVSAIRVNCSEGVNASLTWVPHRANSTWAKQCPGYEYNPPPQTATEGDVTTTTQMHLSGTSHGVGQVSPPLRLGRASSLQDTMQNTERWAADDHSKPRRQRRQDPLRVGRQRVQGRRRDPRRG